MAERDRPTGGRYDLVLAPDMDTELALLLAMLDDNTAYWRRDLGDVSDDTMRFQPFPNGHSIGALLMHIIWAEAMWVREVAAGQPLSPEENAALLRDVTDQFNVQWPPAPDRSLASLYAEHDQVREQTHALVRDIADPDATGTRRSNTFTLRWILYHVVTHESYHMGQAVLLSLMAARP